MFNWSTSRFKQKQKKIVQLKIVYILPHPPLDLQQHNQKWTFPEEENSISGADLKKELLGTDLNSYPGNHFQPDIVASNDPSPSTEEKSTNVKSRL